MGVPAGGGARPAGGGGCGEGARLPPASRGAPAPALRAQRRAPSHLVEPSPPPASFSTEPAKLEPDPRGRTRSPTCSLKIAEAGARLELKSCVAGKKA